MVKEEKKRRDRVFEDRGGVGNEGRYSLNGKTKTLHYDADREELEIRLPSRSSPHLSLTI
jgi:hypothetical protein